MLTSCNNQPAKALQGNAGLLRCREQWRSKWPGDVALRREAKKLWGMIQKVFGVQSQHRILGLWITQEIQLDFVFCLGMCWVVSPKSVCWYVRYVKYCQMATVPSCFWVQKYATRYLSARVVCLQVTRSTAPKTPPGCRKAGTGNICTIVKTLDCSVSFGDGNVWKYVNPFLWGLLTGFFSNPGFGCGESLVTDVTTVDVICIY